MGVRALAGGGLFLSAVFRKEAGGGAPVGPGEHPMKDWLKVTALFVLIVGCLVGGCYIEWSNWTECRAAHSWLYCVDRN